MTTYIESKLNPDGTYDHSEVIEAHKKVDRVEIHAPAESDKEAVRNAALDDSIARCIAVALKEGDGVWRSCTGCQELNEGHDTGAWSDVFKCHLGIGCSECGGIGTIWDDTDYDAMADAMAKSMRPAQPSDTEILDWIIKNDSVSALYGVNVLAEIILAMRAEREGK